MVSNDQNNCDSLLESSDEDERDIIRRAFSRVGSEVKDLLFEKSKKFCVMCRKEKHDKTKIVLEGPGPSCGEANEYLAEDRVMCL